LEDQCDFIAFIDDDEVPAPEWLDELLVAQQAFAADVVSGPVEPVYGPGTPNWIIRGRFFERPRTPTGTRVRFVGTGNVLVSRRVFTDLVGYFDPRFALDGGSDTHLFLRAHEAGAVMIAARSAIVYETVAPTRANAAWLARRAFRLGNCLVVCERSLYPMHVWLPFRLAKCAGLIAKGLVLCVVGAASGRVGVMRAVWSFCRAFGGLAGIAGVSYHEYRVTHGT
jgi:hypothetical protein